MTTNTTARVPLVRPAMTLAELVEHQRADPDLPPRQRQEVIAALNTIGRALGKPLQDIPAHPGALRAALKDVSPAMAGVSEGRWRNVSSLLRGALARAGTAVAPGRYLEPRSPAWAALVGRLDDFRARHRLARLSGYCSLAGIEPAQVTDAVMAQFLDTLLAQAIKGDPHRVHREAILEWNRPPPAGPGAGGLSSPPCGTGGAATRSPGRFSPPRCRPMSGPGSTAWPARIRWPSTTSSRSARPRWGPGSG